jgi:hypothetical protein
MSNKIYMSIVVSIVLTILVSCGQLNKDMDVTIDKQNKEVKSVISEVLIEQTKEDEYIVIELSSERREELLFDLKLGIVKIDDSLDVLTEHGVNPHVEYEKRKAKIIERLENLRRDMLEEIDILENYPNVVGD